MALYRYQKTIASPRKKAINYFSYVSLTAGVLLLFWAFYPVIAFEIYSRVFLAHKTVMPVETKAKAPIEVGPSVQGASYTVLSSNLRDFTQAHLWFPVRAQKNKPETAPPLDEYSLSIPKLNIDRAVVKTKSDDLSKSLVHFLPVSEPGRPGNVAIFGHSTLPQLYNVKDYKTIFTHLPSLNKGDKIIITVKETDYEYEVYEMFVVKPDQVSVLDPRYDASYLTLVTCVPPGTYWNRLVVRARLDPLINVTKNP